MFVASRFVDVTDTLITFAGAAVAWAALRAMDYPVRGALLAAGGGAGREASGGS